MREQESSAGTEFSPRCPVLNPHHSFAGLCMDTSFHRTDWPLPRACVLVFADPLMRWKGWRKCQMYFRAQELSATLQNQNPKQTGMKIWRTRNSHGRWWWIRSTSSCGGAQLRAATFTSTEVSRHPGAWDPGASHVSKLFHSGGFSGCLPGFPLVVFPLPVSSLTHGSLSSLSWPWFYFENLPSRALSTLELICSLLIGTEPSHRSMASIPYSFLSF